MEKKHKCSTCNKTFSTQNNLNTHIKSARYCIKQREIQDADTSQEESLKHKCEKTFTQKKYLQTHTDKCPKKTELKFEERIDEIKNVHKEEFESLINFHDEELQSMNKSHNEELRSMKKSHNEELQLMKNVHNEQIRSIKNTYHKEFQSIKKQIKTAENDKNKLKLDVESYIEKIKELEQILQDTRSEKDINQGRIQELQKVKPSSTTVINKKCINIKLNNISISNIPALTIEYIRANLNKYDYKNINRAMSG
jgi:chromosome segregation ATPase